jgi:hypothetical protein
MESAEIIASSALLFVAPYIVVHHIKAVRAERALRESNQFATEIIRRD